MQEKEEGVGFLCSLAGHTLIWTLYCTESLSKGRGTQWGKLEVKAMSYETWLTCSRWWLLLMLNFISALKMKIRGKDISYNYSTVASTLFYLIKTTPPPPRGHGQMCISNHTKNFGLSLKSYTCESLRTLSHPTGA